MEKIMAMLPYQAEWAREYNERKYIKRLEKGREEKRRERARARESTKVCNS